MVEKKLSMTVKPAPPRNYLCDLAEPYLLKAMENEGEGLIVVNHSLVLKLWQYEVGVGIQKQKGEEGVIRPHWWYFPDDPLARAAIHKAYDEGETHIELPTSQWIELRYVKSVEDPLTGMRLSTHEVLYRAKQSAEMLKTSQRTTTFAERQSYRKLRIY